VPSLYSGVADEENAYFRKRLREIEKEVRAYWEQIVIDAFRESLDRKA
jgi:hypothetical protein